MNFSEFTVISWCRIGDRIKAVLDWQYTHQQAKFDIVTVFAKIKIKNMIQYFNICYFQSKAYMYKGSNYLKHYSILNTVCSAFPSKTRKYNLPIIISSTGRSFI